MKNSHDDALAIPRLERVNYFYGQMLGVKEFQSEQQYFYDKQRLHNRYLHGYGVVCGLAVAPCVERPDPCGRAPTPPAPVPVPVPVPVPKPTPAPPGVTSVAMVSVPAAVASPRATGKPCIVVERGLALSCEGDEIAVRRPVQVDLWQLLDADGRQQLESGNAKGVWVTICYRACPSEPVRPIQLDNCTNSLANCVPSRLRDDFCIKVKVASDTDEPHDCACSPCEDRCDEPCLVLALVRNVTANTVVIESDIDCGVRRPVSLYPTTRICGISWTHGAHYSRDEADQLLDQGLELAFSRDVHGETLTPGVIELWGIEGGDGRSGQVFNIGGEYVGGPPVGPVRSVRYRRNTRERVNSGDRILITLRAAFVLDACCRAVDGEHIGGKVPLIDRPEYARWAKAPVHTICEHPTHPWRTGNAVPGGSFESWLFID